MIRRLRTAVKGGMTFAHAAMYLEAALFAPPAGIVLFSVLRTLRARPNPLIARDPKETSR